MMDMNMQVEEIIWHKSKKELKEGSHLAHILLPGGNELIRDAYYTGAYWVVDRSPFENDSIIAWAELPEGWMDE
jgi:hypothetical protein